MKEVPRIIDMLTHSTAAAFLFHVEELEPDYAWTPWESYGYALALTDYEETM